MRTLIISAITCLLMASCQTNEVGRYQSVSGSMSVIYLDTKEGIIYPMTRNANSNSMARIHLATTKTEIWVNGAWIEKDED
ncbi:hypothetical protein N9545_02505 [Salibacteraceae bacterium]|nr:hypothetical protein [Salibacteraceae bacterium]MDB9710293.1 hypothetical protein [Salibacteraceae bacterium]